jgi:hypothetical protein
LWQRFEAAPPWLGWLDLGESLMELGGALFRLRRWQEAASVTEETLRLLAPFFVFRDSPLDPWMEELVLRYRRCAERCGHSLDRQLLTLVVDRLTANAGRAK